VSLTIHAFFAQLQADFPNLGRFCSIYVPIRCTPVHIGPTGVTSTMPGLTSMRKDRTMADMSPTTDCPVFPYGLPGSIHAWDQEKTRADPGGWINAMSCWANGHPEGAAMVQAYLARPQQNQGQWASGVSRDLTTVYFITSSAGPIKIGHAKNPHRRMRDLQLAGPSELTLAAIVEGPVSLERSYHARFAEHRLHGEWFRPHPDILGEIERLQAVIAAGEGA
jgi:hypothetical protein